MELEFIIDRSEQKNYITVPNTVKCNMCGMIQSRSKLCVVCSAYILIHFDGTGNAEYVNQGKMPTV